MENKSIKWTIDQIKYNLDETKKQISALLGDLMWDRDKELKKEPEYNKKKMADEIITAWKEIGKLEENIKEINGIYMWASQEPEPEDPENEEEIELPF